MRTRRLTERLTCYEYRLIQFAPSPLYLPRERSGDRGGQRREGEAEKGAGKSLALRFRQIYIGLNM